jgi:hypothetical protein
MPWLQWQGGLRALHRAEAFDLLQTIMSAYKGIYTCNMLYLNGDSKQE